jgi:Tfp pilus assembly protein FimT
VTRRAMTLMELVVVIVLTLILSATAIHGFSGLGEWRATAAVRRVHADVLHARQEALLSGRRTVCVFNPATDTYEIRQESSPGVGSISASVIDHPLTDAPWQVELSKMGGGVGISSAPTPTFGFGSDGTPIDTSGARIKRDIGVTFSSGAKLIVRAGSGLSEVTWP